MSVVLLANVGLRDVLLGGRGLAPARSAGLQAVRDFQALAPEMSLPMLLPLVEYAFERHHGRIEVTLYGTDQPEAAGSYRDRDTVHLADLARRLLERSHGDKVARSLSKPIRSANPSLYNEMLRFFRDQLSGRQPWVHDVGTCYVCPVGGIPAANTGLMLAAIERFGERCRTIYLPEGSSRPMPMGMERLMRSSVARWMVMDRLGALAFPEAIPLLEETEAPVWIRALARYAVARYHFDFEAADRALEEMAIPAAAGDPAALEACCRFAGELATLRRKDQEALLREVYHNAVIACRRGEYAGFLGRVFRFQEAVLRFMVEKLYPGLDTDVDSGDKKRRFVAELEKRPNLVGYIQQPEPQAERLDHRNATRPVFRRMVRFAWEGGGSVASQGILEGYRRCCAALDRLDCLSDLRNRCVITHGFDGVSEAMIEAEYRVHGWSTRPEADMATCLESLGISPGRNPFEETAEVAVAALERL